MVESDSKFIRAIVPERRKAYRAVRRSIRCMIMCQGDLTSAGGWKLVSEYVADVPLVVDEVGSSVRVELLAEGAYARLENAGTWKVCEFPYVANDSLG